MSVQSIAVQIPVNLVLIIIISCSFVVSKFSV